METALLIGMAGIALVVLVTAFAPKVGVAPPLLLVVLGIGISLLPVVEPIEIEPEWILVGILPPLLYSAATNIPAMEFRRDFGLISGFSVLLVVVSAVSVGFVMSWLIPDLPLPLGIALGAIVSPTDAVATSIVKKAGISTRMATVLEGESLLNDASALVLLRSAVAAAGTAVTIWQVGLDFLYAVAVAVGLDDLHLVHEAPAAHVDGADRHGRVVGPAWRQVEGPGVGAAPALHREHALQRLPVSGQRAA